MWKISCYRLKEEAVGAAVFTFSRPVAVWHKGNFPAFMSSMESFPSVVSLQIPINKLNPVRLVCSPHFFPSHPSMFCSTLGASSVSHRCPAMACAMQGAKDSFLYHLSELHRVILRTVYPRRNGKVFVVSLCVMWHETCHFAFQFLSFPDRRMERIIMRTPLHDLWVPSKHIPKTAPFNSVPLQELTKPAISLLRPITSSLRQQEKVSLKILILF